MYCNVLAYKLNQLTCDSKEFIGFVEDLNPGLEKFPRIDLHIVLEEKFYPLESLCITFVFPVASYTQCSN